jgi:hypothetical protein
VLDMCFSLYNIIIQGIDLNAFEARTSSLP